MDARGAAESESGSALSAAPVGDEEDFRLPVDWKNLLKTACPAGAGPVVAARPKADFRPDIARYRATPPRQGRVRSASSRRRSPASAGASTSRPCGALGRGAESRLHKWDRGGGVAAISRQELPDSFGGGELARRGLQLLLWFVR